MQKVILGAFLAFEAMLLGCETTFDHQALQERVIEGEDFSAALADEYRMLAAYEAEDMYDWPDAGHFGIKALRAADGETPEPERLQDWRLPREALGELAAARARLVAALSEGAARLAPAAAAHAQVSFDCWIEQQEENWQADHIARCRDGFYRAISDAEAEVLARAKPAVTLVAAVRGSAAAAPRTAIVFFPFDSTALDETTMAAVRELAVRAAASGEKVRVLLAGHTDRAGPDGYNLALSWRRADAVRTAFVEYGVPAAQVTVAGYGEKRPRVETADGTDEPMNRRVEIVVGTATDS